MIVHGRLHRDGKIRPWAICVKNEATNEITRYAQLLRNSWGQKVRLLLLCLPS
jgi:hypothetical protein